MTTAEPSRTITSSLALLDPGRRELVHTLRGDKTTSAHLGVAATIGVPERGGHPGPADPMPGVPRGGSKSCERQRKFARCLRTL
jgi:hypothetical protein